ncbi:MAG: hypothetical protein M0Q37_01435 [Sphaerochaeta sp.]|nr:hypothetical protein [Sphaerochaeta sp.]
MDRFCHVLLELLGFIIYTTFTIRVKVGDIVKITESFLRKAIMRCTHTMELLPVVKECAWVSNTPTGFIAEAVFEDRSTVVFDVVVLPNAYPALIDAYFRSQRAESLDMVPLVMAPFISKESDELCRRLKVGYMDMSGNSMIHTRCIYIREHGNPNLFVQKQRSSKNIFNPTSRISSLILREILSDISRPWRLSALAEELGCSIGQVSKVKNHLCDQLWAEMTGEGLRILDAEAIMRAWSDVYGAHLPRMERLDCYTLLPLAEFEAQVQRAIEQNGFMACLTGLSGGVRYTPVVRYNRVDLLVHERDVDVFLASIACKQVDSGANLRIRVAEGEEYFHDGRIIRSDHVASPVQIVLDCMNDKGRGEEMAVAVFEKEIAR